MDKLTLFPRNNGEKHPVVIIDGHESRLHPSFLDYINHPDHRWHVVLGVPYATSYWQVGDSVSLGPTDIMPLMNIICPEAYMNEANTLKAAASESTIANINEDHHTCDISELNLTGSDQVVSVIDRLVQDSIRQGGMEERKRKLEEGRNIKKVFDEAKKITAGIMVGCGVHSLNDQRLLDAIKKRRADLLTEAKKKKDKKREELRKKIEKVAAV